MTKKLIKNKSSEVDEVNVEEIPNTILLNGALKLVKEKYGIDEKYNLVSFKNKGSKVILDVATSDFELLITIQGTSLVNLLGELGLLEG